MEWMYFVCEKNINLGGQGKMYYIPTNSYVEVPSPNVTTFGDRAFGGK